MVCQLESLQMQTRHTRPILDNGKACDVAASQSSMKLNQVLGELTENSISAATVTETVTAGLANSGMQTGNLAE